ncbi:MFS transporter [Tumebacillus sp. ITR2]|uniref:MFS transporter n=1 Tax=Tumebacillus amylolyticus TaxID=2801339 RepID=A0ABS1JDT7_9BACL|nr:MFS transporter [Tumebacillus amylolyticus]MBL0388413.1 MFS transporter [Tumebacillus amylolyticus]
MSNTTSTAAPGFRDVISNRNYVWLWLGQTISQIGDSLTIVAVPLLVYALTQSATSLTLTFVIESLPWILIGPFAGVLIDRINRRTVLIWVDLLRALIVAAIFFSHSVSLIYVMIFLSQTLAAVFAPARSAVIPELIERDLYVKAISLSQSSFQTVQILGPFLATGVITLFGGPRASFLVDTVTFLAAVSCTMMIRFPKQSVKANAGQPKVSFFKSFGEGTAFLVKHKVLRYVTAINLLKAVTQSVILVSSVLYVKTQLQMSEQDSDRVYGLVVAATAIGIILGTTLIGILDKKLDRRFLIIGGLMLQGATFLLIQFQPGALALILMYGFSGFCASGALTPVSACFAESTPNEVRGRVYSVVNSVIRIALAIGYSAAGLVGAQYGAVALLTYGGILLLVATPILTLLLQGISALQTKQAVVNQTATSAK